MNIIFDAAADSYAVIAYPVAKDELANLSLPLDSGPVVVEGAKAARFEGGAGEVFDIFVSQGGKTLRVALVGTGGNSRSDLERAGGQLVAKYQRSGSSRWQWIWVWAAWRRTGRAPRSSCSVRSCAAGRTTSIAPSFPSSRRSAWLK